MSRCPDCGVRMLEGVIWSHRANVHRDHRFSRTKHIRPTDPVLGCESCPSYFIVAVDLADHVSFIHHRQPSRTERTPLVGVERSDRLSGKHLDDYFEEHADEFEKFEKLTRKLVRTSKRASSV